MSNNEDSIAPPACYDCAGDPAGRLEQMFVEMVQKRRIALGQSPALRPVFRKLHGVAAGRLVVRPDLPAELRVGVFEGSEYPVWLRSSSDAAPTDPDLATTVGLALKLFGVSGPKLHGEGETQDFLFENFDVFFVDTAKDMCEFTYAGVVEGNYQPYLDTHPTTARILKEMARVEGSVLTATYWSVVPFRFGDGRYVKYKLEPETPPENVPDDAADYLAVDFATRLRAGEYRFRFCAQFQTDPGTMPLDKATVRWSEEKSPPVHLATLVLPVQDVDARGQADYGEGLSYNIWRALAVHEPVGSVAEVRRAVYAASADTRRADNGMPLEEPTAPRPPGPVATPSPSSGPSGDGADQCIVKAVIHPVDRHCARRQQPRRLLPRPRDARPTAARAGRPTGRERSR